MEDRCLSSAGRRASNDPRSGTGTTKRHRLEENLGAADVTLTADDLDAIEAAASKITVQGARYPKHLEQMTGR